MFFSNKIELDELGRPSESGRPSAIFARFWTSTMSGSGSGGRMPPPPLNSRGRRWRLLVYSSSRKKPRSACSRQRPEGRARQPDTSVQTDTSIPHSIHPPALISLRLGSATPLRSVAPPRLRLFGHRPSHIQAYRSCLLRRLALLVLTVLLIVLITNCLEHRPVCSGSGARLGTGFLMVVRPLFVLNNQMGQ